LRSRGDNSKKLIRPEYEEIINEGKPDEYTVDLPFSAVQAGFTRGGTAPPRQSKFTLKSGPIGEVEDETEAAAFDLFFPDEFVDHILTNATAIREEKDMTLQATKGNLMKYVIYLMGSGFAQYAQERLPFRKRKHNGLFRNDFLTSLFTYKQLLEAKKMFRGNRDVMTEIFNEMTPSRWVPKQ
jgi:hypothetical protein